MEKSVISKYLYWPQLLHLQSNPDSIYKQFSQLCPSSTYIYNNLMIPLINNIVKKCVTPCVLYNALQNVAYHCCINHLFLLDQKQNIRVYLNELFSVNYKIAKYFNIIKQQYILWIVTNIKYHINSTSPHCVVYC